MAACVPLVDMSCHGSDEQLVFKHELISFFYKNTCISTFVLIHVSNRILRRMGYIFAFSVIFQQFVPQANYYTLKKNQKTTHPNVPQYQTRFFLLTLLHYIVNRSFFYKFPVIQQFLACYAIPFMPLFQDAHYYP